MTVLIVDGLEPVKIEEVRGEQVARARRGGNGNLEAFAQQQAVREAGQRIIFGELRQIMPCRMMLDRRAIQVRDRLQVKTRDHCDEYGFDQEHFGVQRIGMRVERMEGERSHGRHGCEEQACHANFRPDRGPGDHAGAEAENQADGDEVQQGIVDHERGGVEDGEKRCAYIVSDCVAPFPATQA